jgi:hypothetical protein
MDLNHWPSGYEPNELPDCSTPRDKTQTIITIHSFSYFVYKLKR